MWGSNLYPQDQESHTKPTEPARHHGPLIFFFFSLIFHLSFCSMFWETSFIFKPFINFFCCHILTSKLSCSYFMNAVSSLILKNYGVFKMFCAYTISVFIEFLYLLTCFGLSFMAALFSLMSMIFICIFLFMSEMLKTDYKFCVPAGLFFFRTYRLSLFLQRIIFQSPAWRREGGRSLGARVLELAGKGNC